MKFILIIIVLVIYYSYKKYNPIICNVLNINSYNIKKIKMLTYNVQRLPYYFRPLLDIDNLMNMYDIICLQENFCSILGLNQHNYGYNCIIPSGSLYKIANSGLTIYSKLPIQYIDFINYTNLTSVDKISDKGFLIIKVNDMYIINTHLQASYNIDNNFVNEAMSQLNKIITYCSLMDKIVICGDFNIDLQSININNYNKIVTDIPTHWDKMDSNYKNNSSCFEIEGYHPFYFDGGFYKNLSINNIKTVSHDKYSDHLGVEFIINL